MTFRPKQSDPRAAAVLADLRTVVEGLREADGTRRTLVARRMELIHQARAYNVTLDELAKILKVSRGRVRQYEAGE